MQDDPRLEEQALSGAAELGLTSQLDEAEKLDVDVRTDLLKVIQGQADSVSVVGQGLVMQKDIRVQEMELHIDAVDVNPLSAFFGQFELNHPSDAAARLVLTEPDINRALNSEYIRSKIPNLELNVEGKTAVIRPLHLEVHIPTDGKVVFNAKVTLHDEIGQTEQIGFTATVLVQRGKHPLLMEGFSCTPDQGVSLELAIAFIKKLRELINLPYYELEGTSLRVNDVEVQTGRLTLLANAHVKQIPSL